MIIEPNENHRKYFAAVGMAILFVAGFLAAYFWMNAKMQKASRDCAASLAEAAKKTENTLSGAPKIKMPSEIFSASGKVKSIDGRKITLVSSFFGEEKTYQVIVGDDTKIIKREIDLSPLKEGSENAALAPASEETDSKLEDVRIGDSLTVDSDENIKNKTEFTAKSIYIEITTGLPTPPPLPDTSSVPPAPPTSSNGSAAAPSAPVAPPVPFDAPSAPAAPSVTEAPPAP